MQPHDVPARPIVWSAVAIASSVLAVVGAVFLLLRLWGMPAATDRVQQRSQPVMVPPQLQSAPQSDMAQLRAQQQRALEAIGWVDRDRGIARIPVAAAMDLLARTPAPTAAPAAPASAAPASDERGR
jgi:hypothetical protein